MPNRQVLSPIDLRTSEQREGFSKSQRIIQEVTAIMQTLGEHEAVRKERQTLDRVTRAIAGGATNIEAIMAAANEQPSFSGGIPGILQKVGGAFSPPTTGGAREGILQAIIGQTLRQSMAPQSLLTPEEQKQSARYKGGLVARPKAESTATAESDDLLQRKAKNRKDFRSFVTGKPKVKVEGKRFDKAYGKEAYDAALEEARDWANSMGVNEEEVVSNFNAWWDKQAASKDPKGFGKFVMPRKTFISSSNAMIQSAPDISLDPYWDDLDDESKKELLLIYEDPQKLEMALERLRRKYGNVR